MRASASNQSGGLTERGAATRSRILESAADLIWQGGVETTSLDDVMARSAVSKSQLYHYFDDKDALVRAVIALQTDRVLAFQSIYLDALDSLPAMRRWRDAIVEVSRLSHCRGGCPIGTLANELADRSELARQVSAEGFLRWEGMIANGIQAMADRGELRSDVATNDLATAVLGAIQGGLLLAKTMRETRPLELALDMALEHLAQHLR